MKLSDNFIKEKLDDECILVPVGEKYRNGVFTLNETAERIYDLLNDKKDRDEIVTALCREYPDSDPAEAAAFTDEFLAELREAGIIIDD